MSFGEIPVIDLGPLRSGTNPQSVARALHRASCEVGFIYVSNHGIPNALIQQTRQIGLDFFRQDLALKQKVRINQNHRGYLGPGAAVMQDDVLPDLKESFVWGHELLPEEQGLDPAPLFRGHNQWPDSPATLKSLAQRYFEAAHEVAETLLCAFAMGLDLSPDFFLRSSERPISRASLTYYPPQPAEAPCRQFGVGPHTDFGVLTVLCQDHVGGLQVQGVNSDEWIDAPPIEGTLVVNVGDLLARWSNDRYRSTPHRVINHKQQERLSLVLAYDPNHETWVDPAETQDPNHAAKYEPIRCGDYLDWRMNKAFAYRHENRPPA